MAQKPNIKASARPAPPSTMVIFGAGGDLTRRKLFPALYHLLQDQLLPEDFSVIAIDHRERGDEIYREYLQTEVLPFIEHGFDEATWQGLLARVFYLRGDFLQQETYTQLAEKIGQMGEAKHATRSCLFYLATPPRFFSEIATQLGHVGLADESHDHWRRIVVEKPFGTDLDSARALNQTLHQTFEESQIYRIDHYLGKETVQNILMYRFANATVEPIWNHRYIDHVQITVAESVGVGTRAGYYDHAGAMRDMIPNHLLALLSVVAMEPANGLDGESIRDEQAKILRTIQPFTPQQVLTETVRGQYGEGVRADRTLAAAYRDEPRVADGSTTETYVAMKLMIDSWRWAGVPFYLRTGKRMPGRYTEIAVQFKHAPNMMFRDSLVKRENVPPNTLVLRIQPDEGIGMEFNAKVPGPIPQISAVAMDFDYDDYFGSAPTTGYETLIYDCMNGDSTLFKRADVVEAGWSLVQPILDVWGALPPRDFPNYSSGSWGPMEADELLTRDGRSWRTCGASDK